jgi:dihydroorotase
MNILLKKVRIVDQFSNFNLKIKDILIENGIIKKIEDHIEENANSTVFSFHNTHISAGWFDMGVHYKDPGTEWLESMQSLANAAACGGFTEIVGFPNTIPTVQSKESLSYFKNFSKISNVEFLNYGAVTLHCEGKDFTDMLDLYQNGAVGFSDGKYPIQSSDIFLKTLQYLNPIDAPLIHKPEDKYLSLYAQMHEGLTSTLLGLKGIPSAAEELMIQRDLKLLSYAGLKSENSLLHFSTISTKESVELIRKAKKEGLPVSCDIAAHQLAFTDQDLLEFDTNLKVKPPFRSQSDIDALKIGLVDGTIDAVISDHNPLDSELKNLEFDLADFGILGLQTSFQALNTFSNLPINLIVELLAIKPRKLLRRNSPKIEIGESANLTLFDPESESTFHENEIVSLSKNSPFIGKKLKGKVYGTITGSKLFTK